MPHIQMRFFLISSLTCLTADCDSNMITVLTDSMDTIMEDALCETSIPDFGGEEGGEPDFGGEGDEFDIPIP